MEQYFVFRIGKSDASVVRQAKLASDFEQITSWARHARYADVETAMNQARTPPVVSGMGVGTIFSIRRAFRKNVFCHFAARRPIFNYWSSRAITFSYNKNSGMHEQCRLVLACCLTYCNAVLVSCHAVYVFVQQADWTMPIDYQNDLGLTLLHVAAQNGNKRIAKLCLRKGADVNKRNNNGQVGNNGEMYNLNFKPSIYHFYHGYKNTKTTFPK